MRAKFYVGNVRTKLNVGNNDLRCIVFKSFRIPTMESHGELFASITGPFKTRRGAEFMARHGINNPCCQTVRQAEHWAKMEAKEMYANSFSQTTA